MKHVLYKLPFRFKLWWAKQLTYMFRGFGPTFDDDIVLWNELNKWIETKGKPYTNREEYKIKQRIKELQGFIDNYGPTRDFRDWYDIDAWKKEIADLEAKLHGF